MWPRTGDVADAQGLQRIQGDASIAKRTLTLGITFTTLKAVHDLNSEITLLPGIDLQMPEIANCARLNALFAV